MATREVIVLNKATPQLQAAQVGDVYLFPRAQINDGTIFIKEGAAAAADTAAYGQLWVKTVTPNQLWFTDDAGTDFQVATLTGQETFTNKTLTSPVIDTIVADLSVTGTIESADATTPILSTAAGKTNTGYLSLTGKTSGSLKVLPADAMAQIVTIAPAAQTSGACTLTIPDQAGVSSNFVFDTLAATLTNKTLTAPAINGGDYNGVALTTEKGTGWAGATAYSSEITKVGKIVKTHIFVDIQALVVSTTLLDIIGDNDAANSHAGRILPAECGVAIRGQITCLEAPTVGVADIDFYASSAATGAEDADVSALAAPVVLLANAEAWTAGMTKPMTAVPNATSQYIYLAAGAAGTPGTYGAGQFLIELEAYEA
jgi:hypothetical protein